MSAFDSPRERKSYIGIKNRPKVVKQYIVNFGLGSVYSGKFSIIEGDSLDKALIDAYLKYGRRNVVKVTPLTNEGLEIQKIYGRERI